MRNYIAFINSKNLLKNKLVLSLECSLEEAKILQYMARQLLDNANSFSTAKVIEDTFYTEGAQSTHYLKYIKSLLHLGYISLGSRFRDENNDDIALLELLNQDIELSADFLRILECGDSDFVLPQISPYNDDFEYLKDEFHKISLLQKLVSLRKIEKADSKKYSKIKTNIDSITEHINKRLAITNKKINVVSFLKPYNLSEKENIIFFALLKEEYYGKNDYSSNERRKLNVLIELISDDEYSKFNNIYIFDEESKLIKSGLINCREDYCDVMDNSFYISIDVLQKIIYLKTNRKPAKILIETAIKNQDIFELITPKVRFGDIVLPARTKETLKLLTKQLDVNVVNLLKKWGIKNSAHGIDAKIIFYGAPGTGKTATAHALSSALKKPILSFDCSKILSKWVGESQQNVRRIFDSYKNITNDTKRDAILLLDEADQFLGSRSTTITQSVDKMHNQMQNIFLEQIEKFDGILIATTNLLGNIDPAFSRRFNYKIEFPKPDSTQRLEIWKKLLPKNAEYEKDFNIRALSDFETTGGQIKIIIKNTAYIVATRKKPIFHTQDFIDEIKKEISSAFDKEQELGFLK